MAESNKTSPCKQLRKRFLSTEPDSRSDQAILELLLSLSKGGRDVDPVAKELLERYGTLTHVLAAPIDELRKTNGMGEASAVLLKLVDFLLSKQWEQGSADEIPQMHRTDVEPESQAQVESVAAEELPQLSACELERLGSHHNNAQSAEVAPLASNIETGPHATPDREAIPQQTDLMPLGPKNETVRSTESRPKLQVCNGYLLEFDQLARVLHYLLENKNAGRITRASLQESTGLADRQLESLVSMGVALGLIQPKRQILTRIGTLIAENDIFIEKKGTLEWCHYVAAGSHRNLIWFEIFNRLLSLDSQMTQRGWCQELRSSLTGKYTDRTIGQHLHEEVRFVVDAYLERNFQKLALLHQTPEGQLYRRRYAAFEPLVLGAMIYDFGAQTKTQLLQVSEVAMAPGSPALIFGLDTATFRSLIEGLHERGFMRYETTHNLDQIRLKSSLSAFELLSAHFEGRSVREESSAKKGAL